MIFQNHHPSLVVRKTAKSQLRDVLQNTWLVHLRLVKVIKVWETHSQAEPKGDMAAKWNSILDGILKQEEDIR